MVADRTAAATKTDRAYWALRRAIVSGEIREEALLDDADLVIRLGTGRTPVREAIKRLAAEELVVWPPHRTPFVRSTSAADIGHLYEARHLLEVPAARLAAQRATSADVAVLSERCDLFDAAVAADDFYEAAEIDFDFHLALAIAAGNRFVIDAVRHLNRGSLRIWYLSYVHLGTDGVNADHRRMLRAVVDRDPDTAADASREHIQTSHERQLRLHGLDTPFELPTRASAR